MPVPSDSRWSFFRQSSWLTVATCAGSLFMVFVHTVARKMDAAEYSDFFTLLKLLIFISIPGVALQTIFAQQAAAAVTESKKQELAATIRVILQLLLMLWISISTLVWIYLKPLSAWLKIGHPAALWLAITLGLTGSWGPVLKGALQGAHRFTGMGILQALDGPVRFTAMIIIVLLFHGQSIGAVLAVGIGQLSVVATGLWMLRDMLILPKVQFQWNKWLHDSMPLIVGLGTVNLMYSIDLIFVKVVFKDENEKAWYQGATLTGFAIAQFMTPLTAVMFPRIVRSAARNEKTDTLFWALTVTAFFGILAGVIYTLLPKLPLKIIYMNSPEMWKGAPLVPWFAWMLFPLLLANVLVQNSLAHKRYQVLRWLVLVPVCYTLVLWIQRPLLLGLPTITAFRRIAQTLGSFNFLFLFVAVWFDRKRMNQPVEQSQAS